MSYMTPSCELPLISFVPIISLLYFHYYFQSLIRAAFSKGLFLGFPNKVFELFMKGSVGRPILIGFYLIPLPCYHRSDPNSQKENGYHQWQTKDKNALPGPLHSVDSHYLFPLLCRELRITDLWDFLQVSLGSEGSAEILAIYLCRALGKIR